MPRRVQDIIPGDRRAFRDTPPAKPASKQRATREREAPPTRASSREAEHKVSLRRLPLTPPPPQSRKRRGGKLALTVLIIVVVVAIVGWAGSLYYSRAMFTLAARTLPVTVSTAVVVSGTSTPGYLSYQVMKWSASASTTVAATDGASVSSKAAGSVVIYNSYGAQGQRLVAGTRLANSSGLVYRLAGSVVVPGYTLVGGAVKPGSLTAAIVADQPGAEYDLTRAAATSDFKMLGYVGSPKYDGFSARLATDLVGGLSGVKKTVDPAVLAAAADSLRSQLTAQFLSSVKSAVPADSIMYDGAYSSEFGAPGVSGGSTRSAIVSEQGTLYAVLFKRADLVAKLAGQSAVSGFDGFAYASPGLESLSFSVSNAKDFLPQKKSLLIARFSGSMKLIGTIPVAAIRQKLAGLTLSDTEAVLRQYQPVIDIEKSSGELTPPWVTHVPTDPARITVNVTGGS